MPPAFNTLLAGALNIKTQTCDQIVSRTNPTALSPFTTYPDGICCVWLNCQCCQCAGSPLCSPGAASPQAPSLQTPKADLCSKLGMDLKRTMLLRLARRDPQLHPEDPARREAIYDKYKVGSWPAGPALVPAAWRGTCHLCWCSYAEGQGNKNIKYKHHRVFLVSLQLAIFVVII